jgi:hypothetical protein
MDTELFRSAEEKQEDIEFEMKFLERNLESKIR